MPQLDFQVETFYDAASKVWSGGNLLHNYDDNLSIGRLLYKEMRRRPQKVCQISDTEHLSLTNEEALQQAVSVAQYFRAQGITQQDVVGLAARNSSYVMAVVLACFFNGTAFHAVNPYRDAATTKQLFGITKPKLIFFDGQDYEKIRNTTNELTTRLFTLQNHLPEVPSVLDLIASATNEEHFEPAELEQGAAQTLAILCSSGTTGLPKAVTISNNKRILDLAKFLTDADVLFVSSMMDWYSGLLMLLSAIMCGATRIISDQPFTQKYFLEVVHKYRVSFVIQTPPQIAMLLNCPTMSADKLRSMRYFVIGGGKCPISTQQRLQSLLKNGRVVFSYSFTEFGRIATVNYNFAGKPNAEGRVLPGYKFKIISAQGDSLGPGEIGEICCWHGERWLGYYGNAAASLALLDDEGWFHSGDLGYFDTDHYLYVVDRKKDMLKYQGMQYYPNEVEEVIAQLPGVLDMCVFGVWNELEGDAAAAAVVKMEDSALTAEDVVNFVRSEIEVKYKQLNAGAMIVKELPKLPNGKINRKVAKQEYIRGSNL